jgi:hypothetical protein
VTWREARKPQGRPQVIAVYFGGLPDAGMPKIAIPNAEKSERRRSCRQALHAGLTCHRNCTPFAERKGL